MAGIRGTTILALAIAGAARAAVAPFGAPDEMAIFGPEVARAVASHLERAGVDAQVAVTGRIDTLNADRVRLRATVDRRSVEVEGDLERIDELAADLASRLVAVVPLSARRAPAPTKKLAAVKAPEESPRGPVAPPAVGPRPPIPALRPTPEPSVAPRPSPPDLAAPADLAPAAAPPPAPPPPPTVGPVDPKRNADPLQPINPYANPPPPVYVAPGPAHIGRWRHAGSLGRTVMHAVGTPEGCTLGTWASIGGRDFLERRLRIQTVPSNACGIQRTADVAAEAARAGARTVVQAAFDSLRLESPAGGFSRPVGRLRVVVVRDGQVALDRVLDLAARPTPVPDLSRAGYDLVLEGFGVLAHDLQAALTDAR